MVVFHGDESHGRKDQGHQKKSKKCMKLLQLTPSAGLSFEKDHCMNKSNKMRTDNRHPVQPKYGIIQVSCDYFEFILAQA